MKIKSERLALILEKSLAPLYLVAGAEPLLVQESRDLILAAAKCNGFLERNVYHVSGSFDWGSIRDAAAEQSLFSSRSVIDVRLPTGKPGKDGGKFFSQWAGQPDPDRLLIVSCDEWGSGSRKSRWAADLASAGVLVEIWPIRASELPAWVDRRMRASGLRPEREAVRLLADLVEGNLLAAQQEIEKLALLDSGGSVSVDDIRQSVGNSTRFDAFRLSECLLSGRADECLKVASGLRRTGVAIQAVCGALYYQLNQLDAVRSALDNGENEARAFGRLRVFRMAQPLFKVALRRLSERQIGECFQALALIDRQSKGRAAGEPWQTLDRMLNQALYAIKKCGACPACATIIAQLTGETQVKGIFGGTFDPVHYGHLRAASEAKEALALADLRLLPAGTPPHRPAPLAAAEHRLAMLQLSLSGQGDLWADDREVRRAGFSYMVDTLNEIRLEEGDAPLLLLIGQDAANALDSWHRWRQLFTLAHIVILRRPDSREIYSNALLQEVQARVVSEPGLLRRSPAGRVYSLEVTQLAISSTDIRCQVAGGKSPRFLLPDSVISYIRDHGLYACSPSG